ncbi:MAG: BCCT family transporter [Candidatus Azotimanducaceae bacterium WSBS_2022_MAG_OTU7]
MAKKNTGIDLSRLDPPVFFTAVALIVATVLAAAIWPAGMGEMFQSVQAGIVRYASWYYVLVVAVILVSVIICAVTRFGEIKLGPDHAEPDYSFLSWFAMMFSAGMGIGLMFFGVSEPVMHFLSPPLGEPGTVTAAREALKLTFFHWGIHAWAMYAIVALILAYFGYRHGLPLTIRSALYPVFGERIHGPLGVMVDVFAILSTVCGVATSLGFGVLQISAGLNYLFDVPVSAGVQIALIVGATTLATGSVLMGLDAGIKRLSEINIFFAVLLLVVVLSLGPTVLLLQLFVQNTGDYLTDFVAKTFNLYAYTPTDWLGGWTIFYWGWWLSWSPFVGLFIARISRGRTIREFILGALLGPAAFTLLWMTVFGNSAIELILHNGAVGLGEQVQADPAVALFQFFEFLPFAKILSSIAMIMVIVFFVTSADSGAMVVNMLASGGEDDTPIWQRVFWTSTIGITAAVLLLAGGLPSLQTAAVASALPFSLAVLFAIWGFMRALQVDSVKHDALSVQTVADSDIPWQERLGNIFQYPGFEAVVVFQNSIVRPALEEFSGELSKQGIKSSVKDVENESVWLDVYHGDEMDFVYKVRAHELEMNNEALVCNSETIPLDSRYWRSEVHLTEGGQDYDVMGWTREQIINDVLGQYERHLNFLNNTR